MAADDWIHCNKCYRQPSQGASYCFTSCGHIICLKCATAPNGARLNGCLVCMKPANIVDINKNMPPELQHYLRNPLEVASQFMASLKKAMEFQANNRVRLKKYLTENNRKGTRVAEAAMAEVKKRQNIGKKNHEDKSKLADEIGKLRRTNAALQKRMSCMDLQLRRLRSVHGDIDSGFGSSTSNTSSRDVSFNMGFATSTPEWSRSSDVSFSMGFATSTPELSRLLDHSTPQVQKIYFGGLDISPIFPR